MRTVPRPAALGAAVVCVGLAVAGCAEAASEAAEVSSDAGVSVTAADDGFSGTLLSPAPARPDLVLPATDGAAFDLGDRPEGEVTVLFFGYTHCPDLCPTTMADLARARELLDPEIRDRVQVVFVTEDPARDSPQQLRAWLDRFDPEFTGLVGGTEVTAATLAELHLPESAQVEDPPAAIVHPHDAGHAAAGDDHGDYGVDHAGTAYAWGPGGRAVVYTGGTTPEQYAQDLTRLATAG